jgi:hypothetical protein
MQEAGEDAQKLREEKTKLEGMVESHDELITEFTDKFGYNCSDEDMRTRMRMTEEMLSHPLLLHPPPPLSLRHLLLPLR